MTPQDQAGDVVRGPADWPTITAWVRFPLGSTGASPVTVGVGREGAEVGYYSGGTYSRKTEELELWLRLDPAKLAEIPAVREAVRTRAEEAERWLADRREASS